MKKVISVFLAIIMVIGMLEGMAITTLAMNETSQISDKAEVNAAWQKAEKHYAPEISKALGAKATENVQLLDDTREFELIVGGIGMESGDYLANGSVTTTKEQPDEGYAYYYDGILTLHDYVFSGVGYLYYTDDEEHYSAIYSEEDLILVLEGENTLKQTEASSDCITAASVTVSGEGSMKLDGYCGIYASNGDVTVSDSTVAVYADDYGIYAESGTVFIHGGTVTIEAAYYGIFSDEVGISTPSFYNVEGFTHPGSWVNIEAGKVGIFTRVLAVNTGNVSVKGQQAAVILHEDLILGSKSTIQVPATYEVNSVIWDVENACPAQVVFISESNCKYASEYDYSVTHHWYPCLDPDCQLHDMPFFFREYGEHLDEDDDGFCDICAYEKQQGQFDVYVGGAGLTDGDYLSLTGDITGTQPKGGYAHYQNGVLTLHNYQYTGTGYLYDEDETQYEYCSIIYSNAELTIVLEGENALTQTKEYGDCIVGASVAISGEGNLKLAGWNGIWASDNDVGISGGAVMIDTDSNGIYAEQDVIISDGRVDIVSIGNNVTGIYTYYGGVTVSGGSLSITTDDEGIYVYGGDLHISAGTVTVNTDSDGIYVHEGNVDISGGTVDINAHYDGIYTESGNVTISGGTVALEVNGDGMYAYAGNVVISNGKVYIIAGNGGIYAEYDVTISGGQTTVRSSNYSIFAYDEMNISGRNAIVDVSSDNDYALYAAYELYIDNSLMIYVPRAGYVDGCTVNNSDGEYAHKVYVVCAETKDAAVIVAGVGLKNGDYLSNDAFVTSTQAPTTGGYAFYKDGVLTLHDFEYCGEGHPYYMDEDDYINNTVIYSTTDLILVLEGENTVIQTTEYGVCITTPSVVINGKGQLILEGDYGIYTYNGDMSIFDSEVSISAGVDGIYANYGDVTISASYVTINAWGCGIYSDYGNLSICGGVVNVASLYSEGIYVYEGDIVISDGNVTIEANGDGMRINYGEVVISGGVTDITAARMGITAGGIEISGGHIKSTVNGSNKEKYALLSFGDLTLGENVSIRTPRDGEINTMSRDNGAEEYKTICDANGVTALEVELITTYTISWIADDQVFAQTVHMPGDVIEIPDGTPIKETGGCVTYTFSHWENEDDYITMPAKDIAFTAVFDESGEHTWKCESYQWSKSGCQVSLTCTVCGHAQKETVVFSVANGVLTMNYIPTNLSLMIAGYNNGQMMEAQLVDTVAGDVPIESSILKCDDIRVFFLNEYYKPLSNALQVK